MDLDGGEPDYSKAKFNVGTNEYNEPTIRVSGEISIKIKIINLSSQIISKSDLATYSKNLLEKALNKDKEGIYPKGDLGPQALSAAGTTLPKIISYRYETNVTYKIDYTYGESVEDIAHDDFVLAIVDKIPSDKDGICKRILSAEQAH